MSDGVERPIAFASRTLSDSEGNYSQLDREALALVFGVTKFHMFLFGRKFNLVTDNKPLAHIIGPKKGIPPVAAMRLQRWALKLAAYDYSVSVKSSEENANADGLSRLPLPDQQIVNVVELEVAPVFQTVLEQLPIAAADIAAATSKDPILTAVMTHIKSEWPRPCPAVMQRYQSVADELAVVNGCLFRGRRSVIPPVMRDRILKELHVSHAGIVRMKALARTHVWWPGMDAEIEQVAKQCEACQVHGKEEAKVPARRFCRAVRRQDAPHPGRRALEVDGGRIYDDCNLGNDYQGVA